MSAPQAEPDLALFRVLGDARNDLAKDGGLLVPELLALYREMRRLRTVDERMTALQRQGRVGFYGACTGQEAVPIGAARALEPGDWIFPALRESGVLLMRGFPLVKYLAQAFGTSADLARGRQMPSHMSARAANVVSWSSSVGSQLPHAVGTAWAMKRAGARHVALAFLGDGATSTGDFHAAMNLAGVMRAPCVFVCQNNHFAISTPGSRQTASSTFAIKARAYGFPGVRVDGNDVLAVYRSVADARERAVAGRGPSFIECVTYRVGPHSSSDDPRAYRSEEDVAAWAAQDPILRLGRLLRGQGALDDAADHALGEALEREVSDAIKAAEAEPPPARSTLFEDVYQAMPWHLSEQAREPA